MNRQTTENTIRLPAITDAQLVNLFGSLAALNDEGQARFSVRTMHANLEPKASAKDFFEAYAGDWRRSRIISAGEVAVGSQITVRFTRSVTDFSGGQQTASASAWESEAWVQFPENGPSPPAEKLLSVSRLIDKLKTQPQATGSDADASLRELLTSQVAALTDLQTQMLGDLEQERAKREAAYEERLRSLEAEAASRREALEEEFRARQERLDARADELADQKKALDDRGHMHARRQMRAEITADLKARLSKPGVGASTMRQRSAIFLGGGILFAAFVWFAWISSRDLGQMLAQNAAGGNALTYVLLGRFALAAAAVVGLGLYLLGWARALHDTDLQTDRDLERYRYDLDRASWAIETILEAQSKDQGREGGLVPDEWIAGATHGLFAKSDHRSDDHAALEAMGSLLNFAAEAEIGPAGPKLRLTKRGISRLRRSGYVTDAAAG